MSADIERRLIGCVMLNPAISFHAAALAGVNRDWFVDTQCRAAWDISKHMPVEIIDALTVAREAGKRGIDGLDSAFLSDCVADSPSSTYIHHWINELRKEYLLREVKRLGAKMVVEASEPGADPDALLSEAQAWMTASAASVEPPRNPAQVYDEIVTRWESAASTKAVGLPSVWTGIQRIIGGYRKGKVYVFGARPGAGKSTFMMNEVHNLVRLGHKVAVASIEMDEGELRGRMLATDCDKSSFSLDTGFYNHCDFDELRRMAKTHADFPLRINDDAHMPIEKLVAWAQYESLKHAVEFIAVDYLQIISGSGNRKESRNMEVARYMSEICQMAKSVKVPVLVLSQLSRLSPRENRRPDLHDLRDSGSIEQDAYAVMFIHHSIDECNGVESESSEFIIAKNRGGPTGSVKVEFQRNRQRFNERGVV